MESLDNVHHVALVTETKHVPIGELGQVSAALQKQLIRDFAPVWKLSGTVDVFATLEDVPIDYWPMIIRDDIHQPGAAGIHMAEDGQPYALVQYSADWSLTASHEVLEMLADPSGNRMIAGQSPMDGQGRVNFLVEVCDPPEAMEFAYRVNGVTVSDFITPRFYAPVHRKGALYSFTGALTEPRTIAPGGYISWYDPDSDEWFQQVYFGAQPEFRNLGKLSLADGNFRDQIYGRTPDARAARSGGTAALGQVTAARTQARTAGAGRAKLLRQQIDALRTPLP